MFSISARLEANLELNDLLAAYGLEKGGRVQRFIDLYAPPPREAGRRQRRAHPLDASAGWSRHGAAFSIIISSVMRRRDATAKKVIDGCTPYVPASPDRTLEFSAQVSTEIGSGQVIWNTPYAHYQYMGIVYGPNIPILEPETGILLGWFSPPGRPKHPTDRELTYDTSQNPMAGPYWFERAYEETVHWTVSRIPWERPTA